MRKNRVLQYSSLICSLVILGFGLPFYLGYGNPIPFTQNDYTFTDNMWLIVMPVVFILVILGFKWKKVTGLLLFVIVFIAQFMSLIINGEIVLVMMLPIILGVLNILNHKR